ncbi:protein of unknown function [Streptomyces sp. yr375]|uniref:DUF397 domain-containing protein n=1 Tax=Streptomyces sp. yr375 TaxID=1761906 RepID=UPI0008C241AD|nr:DUF397 domain-containing protein [Streptomyces sp. yr375]SER82462.1 protein of unknown function [Streptomyces sp. yr375]
MPPRPTAPELAPEHAWFKSSYSDPGQNCVEAAWIKSSYSDATQNCVEVAAVAPGIAIRDSKNPAGPALLLPSPAWAEFLSSLPEM